MALVLRPRRAAVTVDGRLELLSAQQLRVLAVLMEASGQPCSRARLEHEAWLALGRPVGEQRVVDVTLSKLRKIIAPYRIECVGAHVGWRIARPA